MMIICYFIKPNWFSSDLPPLITREGIQVRQSCLIRIYKWRVAEKSTSNAFIQRFHLLQASLEMEHFSPQTAKEQLNQ